MVSLTRSEAVIALGKALVAQLRADDDLLVSWMAHHIADLIHRAEVASPTEKTTAEEACANAILDLWRHQNALPQHLRPLDESQAVLRTLAFLDLDPNDIRLYPHPMREALLANVDGDVKRAIEFAVGVDYTARVLIRALLQDAAAAAANAMEPWVKLAKAAGAEDAGEQKLMDLVSSENGAGTRGYDSVRAALEDRLNRLEFFAMAAAVETADLRQRLDEISGNASSAFNGER